MPAYICDVSLQTCQGPYWNRNSHVLREHDSIVPFVFLANRMFHNHIYIEGCVWIGYLIRRIYLPTFIGVASLEPQQSHGCPGAKNSLPLEDLNEMWQY